MALPRGSFLLNSEECVALTLELAGPGEDTTELSPWKFFIGDIGIVDGKISSPCAIVVPYGLF